MSEILDSLGLSYDIYESIPQDMAAYSAIFTTVGITGPGYSLSDGENMKFVNYLLGGGRLYLEGSSFWTSTAPLNDYLYHTSAEVPLYTYQYIRGVPSTFTSGASFDYPSNACYSQYDIDPVSPAFSILTTDDTTREILAFAYDGEVYKSIGSQVEFGLLSDSVPSYGKGQLLKDYLSFFGINTVGPWPYFHADSTHICRWHQVQYTCLRLFPETWIIKTPGDKPEISIPYLIPASFEAIECSIIFLPCRSNRVKVIPF